MKRGSFLVSVSISLMTLGLAVACFASGGGEGAHHAGSAAQLKDFGWRVLDFSLLFALLWWALKKADVKGMLAERRAGIERSLREAEEARRAAEQKLAEYKTKLDKASQEIEEMQAVIRKEAELEKEQIVAEARTIAAKIKEDAKGAAEQEVLKARAALRQEAVRLAVELAGQQLVEKITKDDQNRLVGEYLDKVVKL